MTRHTTGILIFPDVEVLDFCGPYEVFSVTRLNPAKRREEPSPFDVFLVAETADPIVTSGGMSVLPKHSFATCPPLDLLVVPGGWGTRPLIEKLHVIEWVKQRAATAKLVASVCTGALVLGRAGLLDGKRATTHWAALDLMREKFPAVDVDATAHWIEHETVITSAGIAAGIDMALKVVARLQGEVIARETARYMEYPFPESDRRRV